MTTYRGKPAELLSSTESGNILRIVDHGDAAISLVAYNGKHRIEIHTTRELIARALRNIGLGVTTLQEAEELRARVEEVERGAQDDIKKLVAIASVLGSVDLEDADDDEDVRVQALQEVYNILHPAPPYTFPTRLGAVVRARKGNQVAQYQLTDDSDTRTWVSHRGDWLTEAQVRAAFTDFETITEGIDE